MILKIRQWCEGIIVAVIISIIIEMIIPEGKNKKYIKVIIGVYIMFVSLSPLLELLKYDFKFDGVFNVDSSIEVTENLDNNMKDVYVLAIEENIKSELENLGYNIDFVNVYTDINYEYIENIELKVNGKKGNIEPIIIGENRNQENYLDIIEFIRNNYFVDSEAIIFK